MPRITPTSYKKLCRVFELEGFKLVRQRGDHLIYVKKGVPRPVVILKRQDIPVFVIKNNLRAARISRERYFELLEQI